MDTQKTTNGLSQACHGFAIEGTYKDCISYGNGHINDTYLLTYEQNDQEHAYILQHMNKTIFTDPEALMENIIGVTGFLKEKIKSRRRKSPAGNSGFCSRRRWETIL